ncbi:D-alanyl-D-alanine carboxypeptidase [Streptomyces xiamenensis]|uniref:D-alanyl-D-alanine carboxypeptidase n=1 Tax=Streptomyces xiamenensis TaxID=408015 RepID=UPI0037D1C081
MAGESPDIAEREQDQQESGGRTSGPPETVPTPEDPRATTTPPDATLSFSTTSDTEREPTPADEAEGAEGAAEDAGAATSAEADGAGPVPPKSKSKSKPKSKPDVRGAGEANSGGDAPAGSDATLHFSPAAALRDKDDSASAGSDASADEADDEAGDAPAKPGAAGRKTAGGKPSGPVRPERDEPAGSDTTDSTGTPSEPERDDRAPAGSDATLHFSPRAAAENADAAPEPADGAGPVPSKKNTGPVKPSAEADGAGSVPPKPDAAPKAGKQDAPARSGAASEASSEAGGEGSVPPKPGAAPKVAKQESPARSDATMVFSAGAAAADGRDVPAQDADGPDSVPAKPSAAPAVPGAVDGGDSLPPKPRSAPGTATSSTGTEKDTPGEGAGRSIPAESAGAAGEDSPDAAAGDDVPPKPATAPAAGGKAPKEDPRSASGAAVPPKGDSRPDASGEAASASGGDGPGRGGADLRKSPPAAQTEAPAKPADAPAKPVDAPAKPDAQPAASAAPAAPVAAPPPAGPPPVADSEREPLELLAALTNTPPPPPTPLRTFVRRVKIWTPLVVLLLVVFSVAQSLRPLPEPTLRLTAAESFTFDGEVPAAPWPSSGQAALDVDGIGSFGTSGDQEPVPIASVAKVMTAYILMRDHPMEADPESTGAEIPVDQKAEDEVALGDSDDESVVSVTSGDVLTQREALQAIMIASANNVARLVARWDAGSEADFVAKMNETAAELGMKNTTYTDPSGLSPDTVSTAEDQVILGKAAMEDPVFRQVVRLPEYYDSNGERQGNWNHLVPMNGTVGIKTGTTTTALGNLLFAAEQTVGEETRLIVGAVLRQPPDPVDLSILTGALNAGKELISFAQEELIEETVLNAGDVVGYVDDGLGGRTPVTVTEDVRAAGWPGLKLTLELNGGEGEEALPHTASAGTEVGTLTVGDGTGGSETTVPVALQHDLTEPGFMARLGRLG